jgi:hypothetical protein
MKQLTIAVAILMLGSAAFCQTSPVDKGSWLISGQGSFMSTGYEHDNDRYTQLSIAAGPGIFVSPGLMVGGNFNLTNASYGGDSQTSWGIGPKLAYFFGANLKKKLPGAVYPYLGASVSLIGMSNGDSETGSQVMFGGGIAYMVTRSVALNAEASYQLQSIYDSTINTFGIQLGFSFFIWESNLGN